MRSSSRFIGACALPVAIASGFLVAGKPEIFGALSGFIAALLILRIPSGRFLFVMGGGLIVLQSDSTLLKAVYAGGLVVCVIVALGRSRTDVGFAFPAWSATGLAVMAVSVASIVPALTYGTGITVWFRSVLPYVLLGLAPLLAQDMSRSKVVGRLWVATLVAFVAPIAFMTDWLDRRGVSALPIDRFALASFPLCLFSFAFLLSRAAATESGRNRNLWLVGAMLVPAAVLLTGTRSAFAIAFSVIAALGVGPGRLRWRSGLLFTGAAVALGTFILPSISSALTNGNDAFFAVRISSLFSTGLNSGDQSLQYRGQQTQVALSLFEQHPLLGVGPGASAPGVTSFDTPIAPLAFFGILGTGVLVVYFVAWSRYALRAAGNFPSPGHVVLVRVMLLGSVLYIPLSSLFDDKGLGLAVLAISVLLPGARSTDSTVKTKQISTARAGHSRA